MPWRTGCGAAEPALLAFQYLCLLPRESEPTAPCVSLVLAKPQAGELVCFDCGIKGMALNLQADHVGIVVFGNDCQIHQGDLVYRTGQIVNVPVGPGTLGRVMDALGQPIDGKGPLQNVRSSLVEVKAPGV